MRDHTENVVEEPVTRSLLDQLLKDSCLYRNGKDYKDLLDFAIRLRNFAPFNAMLLQLQKPGLSYAASAKDWWTRFGRFPKKAARPLLILWPFGPIALVYDVLDTDGCSLPEDVSSFVAYGWIDDRALLGFALLLKRRRIDVLWVDVGDRRAGAIRAERRTRNTQRYSIEINCNHAPAVKFATLAHELGHLALGHLGPDKKRGIPDRSRLTHGRQELEAESVAYVVCQRNGVKSKSQVYLSNFVTANATVDDLVDVYQVMRAAGQVEALLGLSARAQFDRPVTARQHLTVEMGFQTRVDIEHTPVRRSLADRLAVSTRAPDKWGRNASIT